MNTHDDIEQEVIKTLESLDEVEDIEVSPLLFHPRPGQNSGSGTT